MSIIVRHITPGGVIEFTDYAEYEAYLKANTPQADPVDVAKQQIKEERRKIKAFCIDLIEDLEAELIVSGLQSESKQVRMKMKQGTANLISTLQNGEIELALDVINSFPNNSKDGKYITDKRLNSLKNSIINFLNT